jgi:hypothetical protein
VRKTRTDVAAFFVLMTLCFGKVVMVSAQVQSTSSSAQADTASDTSAIERIVDGNPSDHFVEDGSFTNIFGTVRYGREAFDDDLVTTISVTDDFGDGCDTFRVTCKVPFRPRNSRNSETRSFQLSLPASVLRYH